MKSNRLARVAMAAAFVLASGLMAVSLPTTASAQSGTPSGKGDFLLFQLENGLPKISDRFDGGSLNTLPDTHNGDLSSWELLGGGDFDGDGYGDFLWVNKWSGEVTIWLMKGNLLKSTPPGLGQVPRLSDGSPARAFIADMDQNGKSDIIWAGGPIPKKPGPVVNPAPNPFGPIVESPSGAPYWYRLWKVDGTIPMVIDSSGTTIGSIQAVGQFDGVGGLDIMTTYAGSVGASTGSVGASTGLHHTRIAFANGTSAEFGKVSAAWRVKGAGDFNGNGTTDLLWHKLDSGQVHIWEMAAGKYLRSHEVGTVSSSVWTIQVVGDFDFNGVSDIAWKRNHDRLTTIWSFDANFKVFHSGAPGTLEDGKIVGVMRMSSRLGFVNMNIADRASTKCSTIDVTVSDSEGVSTIYEGLYWSYEMPSAKKGCLYQVNFTAPIGKYTVTTSKGGVGTAEVRRNGGDTSPDPIPVKPSSGSNPVAEVENLPLNPPKPGDSEGYPYVYKNTFPQIGSIVGKLMKIELPQGGFGNPLKGLRFVKPGRTTADCYDTKAYVELPSGGSLSGELLVPLFDGTQTPNLPVKLVACAFFDKLVPDVVPTLVNIRVTFVRSK